MFLQMIPLFERNILNFWSNGNPGQSFLSSPLFSANGSELFFLLNVALFYGQLSYTFVGNRNMVVEYPSTLPG